MVDSQMEHVLINGQTRAKLHDSNIKIADFLESKTLDENLLAEYPSVARITPSTLAEFLLLGEKMINGRISLKNEMPVMDFIK